MDDRQKERIKWRARRGLLELDIVMQRFFAGPFDELTDAELVAFEALLRMPDNDLLDQVMKRTQPLADPMARALVERLAAL